MWKSFAIGSGWRKSKAPVWFFALAALSLLPKAYSETGAPGVVDAQQAEEAARKKYIDRFYSFTLDKNVMGKAQTPDGKKKGGGKKVRFDNDDGIAYESDLTYHDLSYNTEEEDPSGKQDKNAPPPTRKLFAFVSPHGKLTSAGGSSLLERTVYQFHNKYTEQEKKQAEADAKKGILPPDDKPGTQFKSVYKVVTKEVVDKGNAGGAGGAGASGKQPEKDRVERVYLRDDVKKAVQDVGDQSFETIKRAARDADKQNDEKALPNLTFLYEAAGRAVKSMWNAALTNLTQRRANRAISDDGLGKPELSEHFATCDSWAAASLQQQIAQVKDPKDKQRLQKRLQQISEACKAVTALPYTAVNPRFEADKQGNVQLKTGDLKSEDSIERDERNQLELMKSAGKDVSQLKGNWQYAPDDTKVTRTRYDAGGNAAGEYTETVRDQLDKYNQQLQTAADGYDQVKSRYPDLKYSRQAILNYQIQPESKSIMDIDKPTASQMEELGAAPESSTVPQDYGQEVQEAAKLNSQ